MRIDTFNSSKTDTAAAFEDMRSAMNTNCPKPSFVFLASNVLHNAEAVKAEVAQLGAHAAHGASSCLGTMTDAGDLTQEGAGIAMFVISDSDGDYGTGYRPIAENARAAAALATEDALTAADRAGEIPDVVWLTATPGQEEDVLAGIEDVIGTDVPIIGGSAADNSVVGDWYVLTKEHSGNQAVVVSVLFPSTEVSFAYLNGYAPNGHQGTVTKVDGRKLIEIDHRPALEVYDSWTDAAFNTPSEDNFENILSAATLWPIGREVSKVQGIAHYLLAHPAIANADGSMDLFADLSPGEKISQMSGTSTALADRAERVARQARPRAGRPIAGALMVYCGGCMLSIRDKTNIVLNGTTDALDGAPFLTHFSFGEQGPVVGGGNRHGNLMISCLVFSGSDHFS